MKITYISRAKFGKFTAAIAAAALLAGTAAPGVLAADYTAQLTKTIDMTAAPGAGVPHGSITFTVGTVANLPSWAAGTAVKGTAAQIKSTELTAAFTGGTANTVTVPFTFDSDDFTAPGDYIFSLTETAAGITGLTQDTAARYIVVRVVNTDPTAPTGALRISDINIVNADGTAKADEITNTYTGLRPLGGQAPQRQLCQCRRRVHLYHRAGRPGRNAPRQLGHGKNRRRIGRFLHHHRRHRRFQRGRHR